MFDQPPARLVRGAFVVLGLVVGLTVWFNIASSHAFAPNADGATVVLEGSAMIHGQPLLHGWSLSLDSFWSVDALFYALGVAIIGVHPILMHLVPALLLALCVACGFALVWTGRRPSQRWMGVGLVVVMLCLPSHTGAYFLLQGPWHVATTLYCLLAVLLLARSEFGWRWWVAVVFMTLGLNGDLQMLSLGVVPVALAGGVAMARRRSMRAGIAQLAAALSSIVLALGVRLIAIAIGTFAIHEDHHMVALAQLGRDVGHFVSWFTAIFGVHPGPAPGASIPLVIAIGRVLVVVLVVAGCAAGLWSAVSGAIWGIRRRGVIVATSDDESGEVDRAWRVDDLLVCMTIGAVGTFGLLTLSDHSGYARYLDPVAIFSSILAARVVARRVALVDRRGKVVIFGGLTLVGILCILGSVRAATEPIPVPPTAALEQYLESHQLVHGIGDYWASSIVTVNTKERVIIRPVVANFDHEIVPDGRQASIDWYRGEQFQFLVYEVKPYGRVGLASIKATFGAPPLIVRVGQYFVVTFGHPISVRPQPFP